VSAASSLGQAALEGGGEEIREAFAGIAR